MPAGNDYQLIYSDEFDIVTVPELIVCPDAAGIADPPLAVQPVRSSGEPSDLDGDLHLRVDGIDIPLEVLAAGKWRGDCRRGCWLGRFVVPDGVGRGS